MLVYVMTRRQIINRIIADLLTIGPLESSFIKINQDTNNFIDKVLSSFSFNADSSAKFQSGAKLLTPNRTGET